MKMENENKNSDQILGLKRESLRDGFGRGLVEIAESDKRIVALSADLSESIKMNDFKKKFPDRFFEVGVAEQNLATVASGLASAGKIPFIGSFAVFSPGRNWEQIRTTICLNNQKVVIVGGHGGLSVGEDGATHQSLEDLALMRVLPNMTVLAPIDAREAFEATLEAVKIAGPVYLRLSRPETPVFSDDDFKFKIGKIRFLLKSEKEKPKVAIFVCGSIAHEALLAGLALQVEGVPVSVIGVSTIKPLDPEIALIAKEAGAVVTVEDHQVAGGLGSAIAELLAGTNPTPIEFVGVKDRFGQSGKPDELYKEYGLKSENIISAVFRVLERKTERLGVEN